MKNLLMPTLSVMSSTAGVAYGCRAFGMPPDDVALATVLAGIIGSFAAVSAMVLTRPRRKAVIPPNAAPLR